MLYSSCQGKEGQGMVVASTWKSSAKYIQTVSKAAIIALLTDCMVCLWFLNHYKTQVNMLEDILCTLSKEIAVVTVIYVCICMYTKLNTFTTPITCTSNTWTHICDWVCKTQPCEHKNQLILSHLLCHNLITISILTQQNIYY